MKITVLTLFPKMIRGFFEESIIKRAQDKNLVEIKIVNIRDFAKDKYKTVDNKPYGGGVGMVLRVDILKIALDSVKKPSSRVVLTSVHGRTFSQEKAKEYLKLENLIIIAGHYEGVDERILDYVDEEISLGDFVMTGGEIAIAAIVDSVVRLLPGVLKKEDATQKESFFNCSIDKLLEMVGDNKVLLDLKKKEIKKVRLLEYPQFTRPEKFEGKKVPEILMGGNHKDIETWRLKKAFEETLKKRPDLLSVAK